MGQPFRAVRNPRHPLDSERQARLRQRIRDLSVEEVAAGMGVSPNTVTNLAAGRGCNDSSKMLARIYLDSVA
jgi:hypothetical protein